MRTGFGQALDTITRVRGVHGALLVAGDDGLIIAEALMEGVDGKAVAALASSLTKRMRRSMEACNAGPPHFMHLQATDGTFFGALDRGISVDSVRRFEAAMEEAGKSASIHIYENADHAFANPSGSRYNAEAAEDAWRKTTAFLKEHLQTGGAG